MQQAKGCHKNNKDEKVVQKQIMQITRIVYFKFFRGESQNVSLYSFKSLKFNFLHRFSITSLLYFGFVDEGLAALFTSVTGFQATIEAYTK